MIQFRDLKTSTKLFLMIGIFLAGFCIFGYFAMTGLYRVQVNGPLYKTIAQGNELLADILPPPEFIIEAYLTSYQMLLEVENGRVEELPGLVEYASQLKQTHEDRNAYWEKTLAEGEIRDELLNISNDAIDQYFEILNTQYVPLLEAGETENAQALLAGEMTDLFNQHRKSIDKITALSTAENTQREESARKDTTQLSALLLVIGVLSILGSIVTGFVIIRGIVGPVSAMVEVSRQIAVGNVSQQIELESKDELGQLADGFRKMIAYLQNITGTANLMAANNLTQNVIPQSEKDSLGVAFREMSRSLRDTVSSVISGAETLSAASHLLQEKANSVALSAEDMTSNTISVAAGMEQASTNLRSIATATEEMNATIGEIARNTEKARSVTSEAVRQSETMTTNFSELGHAAMEIGKITETITAISAQTKLLALNATIEAARAGASGKGFAVVATEIKELALQAATATEDIKGKIASVQNSTSSAVEDIERITKVVEEVNQIVTSIATAIEEQSVVTRDIAENIAQATYGVDESTKRAAQNSIIVQSVTRDIKGSSNGHTSDYSAILPNVKELAELANRLYDTVSRFKVA